MHVSVIALDDDGTIAENGVLDPHVRDAIRDVRRQGIAVAFGGAAPLPRPYEVARTLRHPDVSMVVDLSRLRHDDKRDYVATDDPHDRFRPASIN
jgi:hydroxymethylpyrimidine pyrophosphatase-like HAD family hydrolase